MILTISRALELAPGLNCCNIFKRRYLLIAAPLGMPLVLQDRGGVLLDNLVQKNGETETP